jgi:hypothetical protein
MPRRCSVCASKHKNAVDSDLLAGSAIRHIAQRYSLSPDAVRRHHRNHLPVALSAAHDVEVIADADALVQQVHDLQAETRDLQDSALSLLAKAETAGDLRTAVAANREARGCVELLARLRGELNAASVNVAVINATRDTNAELEEWREAAFEQRVLMRWVSDDELRESIRLWELAHERRERGDAAFHEPSYDERQRAAGKEIIILPAARPPR